MSIARSWILVSVLICLAIAGWVVYLFRQMPTVQDVHQQELAVQEVFQFYSAALISHDYERAFQFCDNDFKSVTPYGVFASQQHRLEADNGKLVEIKQAGVAVYAKGNVPEWTAVINADYRFDKHTAQLHHEFLLRDGKWVLTHYRLEQH